VALCSIAALSACEEGASLFGTTTTAPETSTTTTLVERDVEAPDVFQANENGLWDGRPSLGGVWVASTDATDPERVIIRNETNGKFVIGALFRRERELPGPKLQVSSDAAAAIGMLAGQPTLLNVTALRREEVPVEPPVEATAPAPTEEIETETLADDDAIAVAAAALDAMDDTKESAPAAAPATTPAPAAAPAATSSLEKPFIQVGIFSVEANANRTGKILRDGGLVPEILAQESKGKPFWRVIVGPAGNSSQRAALLKTVKELGYTDAYFVTN
jgi:cell division septation protein DedD